MEQKRPADIFKELLDYLWDADDAQALALQEVKDYTLTFNKMHFIETEERDEIYMALCDILDEMPESSIQKNDLLEKFEELRDF